VWMFYDTNVSIDLAQNQIAQSKHFFFAGSTLPSSSTTPQTTSSSIPQPKSTTHHGLAAGAAAGIAIVMTLLVVVLVALGWFFLFYRERQRNTSASTATNVVEYPSSEMKPELDGSYSAYTATKNAPVVAQYEMSTSTASFPTTTSRPELSSAAVVQHEMPGNTKDHLHANASLPSTSGGHELPTHFQQSTELPGDIKNHLLSIKRKQVRNSIING
jgi:hypothetical protein